MGRKNSLQLLVADKKGKISSLSSFRPAGMKAGYYFEITSQDLIQLPKESSLFVLPRRLPVGFDPQTGDAISLDNYYAVSAFVSPGYTLSLNAAFKAQDKNAVLPLFAYGAVCLYKDKFHVAAFRVDKEKRQDESLMDCRAIEKNSKRLISQYPRNRLIKHLTTCALKYNCPAAKNFFLSRYEAPLPSSPKCNARCIGCISYQPCGNIPVTQPRIKFIPKPEELSEVALYHIQRVKSPVVSFGQGCEGEPLMVSDVLIKAVKLIRKQTSKGLINLNTNASRPDEIATLFDAGLNSIRVSLNSARKNYYQKYYRPARYTFKDVKASIKKANQQSGFVSLNYLIMPGFNDVYDEFLSLKDFIHKSNINMIQWRNLNFDPLKYFELLKIKPKPENMMGVKQLVKQVRKEFPYLHSGYFNPSHSRIKRKAQ